MANWIGKPHIKGSTETVRMVLLTFTTIGITFTWGVEMTYGTPYLLNLGLTKSSTSLVWIAGPLSGLIVQPIVGAISDDSRHPWGRRRPFMVLGACVTTLAFLTLGFTKEIVSMFVADKDAAKVPTIVLAVLAIYVVDFAVNAVMSCARSLIVDTLPIDKQQTGAAWGSRMNAIGHVIGYAAGAIDLVGAFGTLLGDTQFKQLTVIASAAMLGSVAVTCWAVTERRFVAPKSTAPASNLKVLQQVYSTVLNLPPRIQAICWAQFWSWIGWFPFCFYSTTWVGETYFRYDLPADARQSHDMLGEIGRIGSLSLVLYSCVTFVGAAILPVLVKSPEEKSYTQRPPKAIAGFVDSFQKVKPDLLTAWMCGHIVFALSMFMAPFATSFKFATFLMCMCGLPWSLACWAPPAFLGVEVNKLSSGKSRLPPSRHTSNTSDIDLAASTSTEETQTFLESGGADPHSSSSSSGELSGIYFGILNIYTTIPQFLGTFISTIVFSALEPGKSPELHGDQGGADGGGAKAPATTGVNAISVCLFIGAMSTAYAAVVTRRLRYV